MSGKKEREEEQKEEEGRGEEGATERDEKRMKRTTYTVKKSPLTFLAFLEGACESSADKEYTLHAILYMTAGLLANLYHSLTVDRDKVVQCL